ncbi:alkaline phosphatase D family protein [Aeromonas hydrophila]|uniref:alkaline phosphatase D family protein n=1 Tax=Aeromonas hydrophila TaxID=644 RepID=UPI002B49598D|nr:alkaline phosphatase D family protein [Aeromonas hydrophila]
MSTLRAPALGPIVGHTTHNSCRLWIAASNALDEKGLDEEVRTIGVLGVVGKNGKVKPGDIFYFRLHREYDRTGTFNLGVDKSLWKDSAEEQKLEPYKLKPATTYAVRMASLNLDDAYPNDSNVSSEGIAAKLPPARVWEDKLNLEDGLGEAFAEATFTTQPEPGQTAGLLSFLLGSCRYPGLLWKRKEADRIFGPMLAQHEARPVNLALMVGDQIYADMFHRMVPIGLADTYEEFQERYHSAFGSRNMRKLLSRVPTYMILDDHEIEDNWTQDRLHESNAKRMLFNLAIGAYMSYQWSHGPRFADSYVHDPAYDADYLKRMDTLNLFYDFLCAGYPFFVLDTRTQRYRNDMQGLTDNHLLGRPALDPNELSQLDRICAWLKHMQGTRGNVPKFVVSSSVFLPNGVDTLHSEKHKAKDDSWPCFPNTRRQILKTIVEEEVQNVIFLSGDIHCSSVAQMEFTGPGAALKAYSIVSSAFYWPFAFADGDPAGYVHNSRDAKTMDGFEISPTLGTMHYRAWGFIQDDNFCRIDVDPTAAELAVQAFDGKGAPIVRSHQNGSRPNQPERLKLEPW